MLFGKALSGREPAMLNGAWLAGGNSQQQGKGFIRFFCLAAKSKGMRGSDTALTGFTRAY
jgi:hypothetical protein